MDILSYKLGKNASGGGGGGDTPEYFVTTPQQSKNEVSISRIIKEIPLINFSGLTNTNYFFSGCQNLTTIPLINISNSTDTRNMFSYCSSLTTIPQLNMSNVTNSSGMFDECSNLEEIPDLNTSKVTSMNAMFSKCSNLTTIGLLDGSSVVNMNNMFRSCNKLENFDGIKDLGKAYLTTTSANNTNYTLDLAWSNKLTHDSLVSIINNLYDIATKGCNTQTLNIGGTNKAKLSAEEIAIATNKGWDVQ